MSNTKINLDKLILSFLKSNDYNNLVILDALKEQGLEVRDGELVESVAAAEEKALDNMRKLAESQKNIEPEIQQAVNEYFDKWLLEDEPTSEINAKFKDGDWVIWQNKYYKVNYNGCGYELIDQNGLSTSLEYGTVDKSAHLWTINDAKDGDVLSYVTDEEDLWIMIYWSLYEPYEGHVHYHALLVNDNFGDKGTCCICIDDLKPATKEQRDLLFKKMKEADYEWDAENKELKELEEISGN